MSVGLRQPQNHEYLQFSQLLPLQGVCPQLIGFGGTPRRRVSVAWWRVRAGWLCRVKLPSFTWFGVLAEG
jgi:hypothetical protein